MSVRRFLVLLAASLWLGGSVPSGAEPVAPTRPEDVPAQPAEPGEPAEAETAPAPAEPAGTPVKNWLEAQVALSRRGFSCGSIDGVRGPQSAAALLAFQQNEGLRESGDLDPDTRAALTLATPALTTHTFTVEELATLHPLPDTWVGKSELKAMNHATALELVSERHHASPALVKRLNPDFNWDQVMGGAQVTVPDVPVFTTDAHAARLIIRLADHVLEAVDDQGRILVHFPVSIARHVEKRPVGELHVTVVIPDPDYTFDPDVFPESPEARELNHKLIIPPGPNNPVGVAWIGLDRTGYGIHGTPDPEKVGRTESHGCFRLANWDARALLGIAWTGMPVVVQP